LGETSGGTDFSLALPVGWFSRAFNQAVEVAAREMKTNETDQIPEKSAAA
jgi:hypothetical protein